MNPRIIWIISLIMILLPICATVLSMCSYVGKVLAMRILFRKNEKGDK